jgi:tryptophan synthase alpha chain
VTNRIDQCFGELKAQSRQALIPFITVGDPHPGWTGHIMHELVSAGADIVELGVPFSDPMADGPVIQEASERAIARGVSLESVLLTVGEFRRRDQHTPVVLMGYMNPLERYGHDAFARDAAKAGVDGVLMVDCPPEEMGQLASTLLANGVYPIYLIAPTTTPERMEIIAQNGHGYLYYVSFKGITGANRLDQAGIAVPLQEIRLHTRLPVAVGFGIKDPAAAAAVACFADAVVIGSALVQALATATSAAEAAQRAHDFLAPVRKAMDNGRAFDSAGRMTR